MSTSADYISSARFATENLSALLVNFLIMLQRCEYEN